MTTQLKALAQHLNIEFFDFDGETYTGTSKEEFNRVIELCEMDGEIETVENWLENNCTLLSDEIIESSYDGNIFEYSGQEFLVVDDDEANNLWEQSLDSYLEDCIYPELTGNLAQYFDDEKWKNDARYDGRGHSLSGYDGVEYKEDVETEEGIETYYIYRTN